MKGLFFNRGGTGCLAIVCLGWLLFGFEFHRKLWKQSHCQSQKMLVRRRNFFSS